MATKTIGSDQFPAKAFLCTPDANDPASWKMLVCNPDGSPNPKRMAAAWMALTFENGYNGQKYTGPDAAEATKKLKAMYDDMKATPPSESKDVSAEELGIENKADSVMKQEPDGNHPADHYLVVGDPDKVATWSLRYKDAEGKIDNRLLGAIHAALTVGYRGNTYEGPKKSEALDQLKKLYAQQKLKWPEDQSATPSSKGFPAVYVLGEDIPAPNWDDLSEYKSHHPEEEAEIEIEALVASWEERPELKTVPFDVSTEGLGPNEFAGYGAIFGNMDKVGEIVKEKFFADSLPEYSGKVCWQHKWDKPIGKALRVNEDHKGLFVHGRISETTDGKDALVLMRDGVVNELSVGYVTNKGFYLTPAQGKALFGSEANYQKALSRVPKRKPGIRVLEKGRLLEVSPVTIPANDEAKILAVKSLYGEEPLAGLTLEEHFKSLLAGEDEFLIRLRDLYELRTKSGRKLSGVNLDRLTTIATKLREQLSQVDSLLEAVRPLEDSGDDEAAKALERKALYEMTRFSQLQARLVGVDIP